MCCVPFYMLSVLLSAFGRLIKSICIEHGIIKQQFLGGASVYESQTGINIYFWEEISV